MILVLIMVHYLRLLKAAIRFMRPYFLHIKVYVQLVFPQALSTIMLEIAILLQTHLLLRLIVFDLSWTYHQMMLPVVQRQIKP